MKKALSGLIVALFFTHCAVTAQEPNTLSEREKNAGFELLFDGKGLDQDIWLGAERYTVEDGAMVCKPGGNIVTKKNYKDFVLRLEFKLPKAGNNGVGIRTKPNVDAAYDGYEVQILDDTDPVYKNLQPWQAHGSVYRFAPAKKGSLKPVGEWNDEEIVVFGNRIKVTCNGQIIVDADLTEYVEGRKQPLDGKKHAFNATGAIGFLGHGDPVAFRSVRVKELENTEEAKPFLEANTNELSECEKNAGFELLFDGKKVDGDIWDSPERYTVEDGAMVCKPGGNIVTKKHYKDFVIRFEFKLPKAGNNGIGLRTKPDIQPAFDGFEVQILDDADEAYKDIDPWQAHGSVYRMVPAKRGGVLRPVGQWNCEEIIIYGNKIKVTCNGQVIVDADVSEYVEGKKKPLDNKPHIFNETGSIGLIGHGDPVAFRSMRVKTLENEEQAKEFFEGK